MVTSREIRRPTLNEFLCLGRLQPVVQKRRGKDCCAYLRSKALEQDDTDSLISLPEIWVLLPFGVTREHLPCCLVGNAPVLAGDEPCNTSVVLGPYQFLLQLPAEGAANAAGTVPMHQFDGNESLRAGEMEFSLHSQSRLLHLGHTFLEIDELD